MRTTLKANIQDYNDSQVCIEMDLGETAALTGALLFFCMRSSIAAAMQLDLWCKLSTEELQKDFIDRETKNPNETDCQAWKLMKELLLHRAALVELKKANEQSEPTNPGA